jgi:integrase
MDEHRVFTSSGIYKERSYEKESEMEDVAKERFSDFFGAGTIYLDIKTKVTGRLRPRITDGVLLDFRNRARPRLWIVEFELTKHDLQKHVLPQLMGFARALDHEESRQELADAIFEEINSSEPKSRLFKELSGEETEIHRAIGKIIRQGHGIMVVVNGDSDIMVEILRSIPEEALLLVLRTFNKDGERINLITQVAVRERRTRAEDSTQVGNYGPNEWIQSAPRSARGARKKTLDMWAATNGFNDPVLLWKKVRQAQEDPYTTATTMIEKLERQEVANSSIELYRGRLKEFYKVAGIEFKEDLFERTVKKVRVIRREPGYASPEQLGTLFELSPLPVGALCHFLISTGCPRAEAFQVQMKDIQWESKPARVKFYAENRGVREERVSFLSSETVAILREFLGKTSASDAYVFKGAISSPGYASQMMNRWLERAGIRRQGSDGKWSFVPDHFRNVNLKISLDGGLPESWAKYLAGYKEDDRLSFISIDDLAQAWLEKVDPRMHFRSQSNSSKLKQTDRSQSSSK